MSRVFVKAIQSSRTLPTEVHVRSQELKDSIGQFRGSFGVKLRVARRLPAVDHKPEHICSDSSVASRSGRSICVRNVAAAAPHRLRDRYREVGIAPAAPMKLPSLREGG